VPGVGLGIDGGVGPAGEINTLFRYNAGQYVPSIIASESVTIGVNGLISSIIVSTTAYAREAGGDWHLLPLYPYDYPYNQPLELAFNTGDPYDAAAAWRPFIVDTGITRPFNVRDDEFINFLNYRQAHIDEAEDIMTGISVVSISYVPAVPDATSTAGLVAMCFAVLLCCKGRRLVMGAGPRP